MQVYNLHAEVPSNPNNLNYNLSSRVLSVKWSAPDNIDRFDLEYYRVQVLIIMSESDKSYYLNRTTSEQVYIFDLDFFSPGSSILLHSMNVTAVSKCGQRSPVMAKLLLERVDAMPEAQSSGSFNGNCE